MADSQGFEEHDYSQRFDMGIWKKLFSYAKELRFYMLALIIVMIAVAVIDGIFPLMTRYAIDVLIPQLGQKQSESAQLTFLIQYVSLALIQGANVWGLIMIAGVIEVRLCHRLRTVAFQRLQELSFDYFDNTPAGWIIARLNSDAQRLGDVIAWGLVDLVWGSAMMVSIVVFMFVMNPLLAAITLAFIPVLIAATFWFQRRILLSQRKVRKANSYLSGVFNEGLQGARTSKTLGVEQYNINTFKKDSQGLKGHAIHSAFLSALYMPIVIFLAAGGAALALGAGGTMLVQGLISFGTMVAFVNYAMLFFDPAREVARVLAEFQSAQASAERLIGLIETRAKIEDSPQAIALDQDQGLGDILGDIELQDLSFRYGHGPWIFKNFNLQIPQGQILAVVGETGSGKSSLVNILCRFYEPNSGMVKIDGSDYRCHTQYWLHSRLGYVLQTPLLFAGSIRDNIRYGRLEASNTDIENAASDANAMSFIARLEKGLDTHVGEGGVLLSTGQKQLISLARALLAKPRIMVLDEATSSIDTEAEQLIQEAVNRLLAGRTSIVIAHRLSTIRHAHRIIVLEQGRIIEDGPHEQLMAARGHYWRLYTRQFIEEVSTKGDY